MGDRCFLNKRVLTHVTYDIDNSSGATWVYTLLEGTMATFQYQP